MGYGQVSAPVMQSSKAPGLFNALGQAVKNAAAERKDVAIGGADCWGKSTQAA